MYKKQLGGFLQVINGGREKNFQNPLSESEMNDLKANVHSGHKDEDDQLIIDSLLELRVNALQIAPELRRNLISNLIKNDIFNIR